MLSSGHITTSNLGHRVKAEDVKPVKKSNKIQAHTMMAIKSSTIKGTSNHNKSSLGNLHNQSSNPMLNPNSSTTGISQRNSSIAAIPMDNGAKETTPISLKKSFETAKDNSRKIRASRKERDSKMKSVYKSRVVSYAMPGGGMGGGFGGPGAKISSPSAADLHTH